MASSAYRPAHSLQQRPWVAAALIAFLMTAMSSAASEGAADALAKVGEARLKVMFWSVYDSRLYTPSGDYQGSERPLRLEIEYLRNVKSKALVDNTLNEWESMGREHPRQEAWLTTLAELWPDVQESDVLTMDLNESNVTTFRHNGEVLGRIDDPEFGQQFIDIWLSADSTRPRLRDALLGD